MKLSIVMKIKILAIDIEKSLRVQFHFTKNKEIKSKSVVFFPSLNIYK